MYLHLFSLNAPALHCIFAASGKKGDITLGGRDFGKLKLSAINKLMANYYGKAVRDHPNDSSGMQSAILATFEHATSTDDKPQHDRCQVGAVSTRHLPLGRSPDQTNNM